MKISLIFTPNYLNPNFKQIEFRDKNIGKITPLGLLTVAALFEREGVEVQIIDIDAENLSYEQTLKKLKQFSPDLLGFTISTLSFHPLMSWIRRFKKDTCLPVIVGGGWVEFYPDEIMTYPEIDYLIIGEAELPLPQFVQAFKNKGRDLDRIKSFGYRKNGKVYINKEPAGVVMNLDLLPFPSRHLIKNGIYYNILSRRKNFTAMLSSRGCPYHCAFCNQHIPPYRLRSAENFIAEIKDNYKRFNIRELDVYDSTFTADRRRVVEICRLIIKERLDVSWTVRSRVDSVNEEMLNSLKAAGCHTILYGIESSNPSILKAMNKGISIDRIRKTLAYTKKIGIETFGYFMLGFPGETKQTVEDTIRFSLKLPLDYAQYTVLVPYPHTPIYEYYMSHGMEDYWREYTLNASKEREVELVGTEITRQAVSRAVANAYRRFYIRPRIILKCMMKVRSFVELSRFAKGAIGVITNWLCNRN